MRFNKIIFSFIALIFLGGCNYSQVSINNELGEKYVINYDNSIPESIKNKLNFVFNQSDIKDRKEAIQINLSGYQSSEYKIYAGAQLRSLEGEVSSSLTFNIDSPQDVQKEINIVRRYDSNELNPFADKEAYKLVKKNINDEIIDRIILEVSLLEM
jgi:hypothetical protein